MIIYGSSVYSPSTCLQMFLHGKSMANVYETVDMAVLPAVYLPDDYTGPNAETAEQIVGKNKGNRVKV